MKGASAEPLLRTTNPPKTATMKITGINQNFLRVRRNAHSSCRNAIVTSSDLLFPELVEAACLKPHPLGGGVRCGSRGARAPFDCRHESGPVIRWCGNPYSTRLISSQSRLNARARLNAIERPRVKIWRNGELQLQRAVDGLVLHGLATGWKAVHGRPC